MLDNYLQIVGILLILQFSVCIILFSYTIYI